MPAGLPAPNDITNIIVDEVSCDGITGTILQAVAALKQGQLAVAQVRQQFASRFRATVGGDFSQFAEEAKQQVLAELDKQRGSSDENGFMRYLSGGDANGLFDNLSDPLAPVTDVQPSHVDNFSLFGDDVYGGTDVGTSQGSGAEVNPNLCDGVMSTALNAAPTVRLDANTAAIQSRLRSAGKVASFANTLVQDPTRLVDSLLVTLEDINKFLTQSATASDSMLKLVSRVSQTVRQLTEDDYSRTQDLAAFNNLLSQATSTAKRASDAVAAGDSAATVKSLDAELITAIERAAGWINISSGAERLIAIQSGTLGDVMLLTQQLNLMQSMVGRATPRISNVIGALAKLTGDTGSSSGSTPAAYYANVFTSIYCRLRKIQDELSTINQQKTQQFFVKRLQWSANLQTMRLVAQRFSITEYTQKLTVAVSESAAGKAVAKFSLAVNTDKIVELEDALANVMLAVESFVRVARSRLRTVVSDSTIIAAEERVNRAAKTYRAAQDDVASALSTALTGNETARKSAEAFLVASAAVAALAPIVVAIRDGDFQKAFSKDAVNDALDNLVARLLAKATDCCSASGKQDSVSIAGLARLTELQKRASDDSRLRELDAVVGSDLGSRASLSAKLDVRRIKQYIREMTQLMKIPCLGGVADLPPMLF